MLEDVERSLIFIKHRLQHTSNTSFVLGCERESCIRLATVFNIVDRAHAHYADFAGICIHGDDLLFVFVSRVATWVFKLQYGEKTNESLKTSDLSSNRKEIGQRVSEIVISQPNYVFRLEENVSRAMGQLHRANKTH